MGLLFLPRPATTVVYPPEHPTIRRPRSTSEAYATKGGPTIADEKRGEHNPWKRFQVFVSKVVAVPKVEADEKHPEYERQRDKKRAG